VVRYFAAVLCVALTGVPVDAGESPERIPPDPEAAFEKLSPALDKLAGARRKMAFVRTAGEKKLNEAGLVAVAARLNDVSRDLEKVRDDLRAVVVELRLAALKSALSGRQERQAEWFGKLADDVQRFVGDRDPKNSPLLKASEQLAELSKAFEKNGSATDDSLSVADIAVHTAVRAAEGIALELGGAVSLARLIGLLKEIRERQLRIRRELSAICEDRVPPTIPKDPWIGTVEPVVLEKRGRVIVTHKLEWRQYPEDELEVKVTASDPSLTVPATLKLDFEKHQFRFEYEVKAGDTAGEFTVTVTPAVGKPVSVKVSVK
jgi:hypothetical protein